MSGFAKVMKSLGSAIPVVGQGVSAATGIADAIMGPGGASAPAAQMSPTSPVSPPPALVPQAAPAAPNINLATGPKIPVQQPEPTEMGNQQVPSLFEFLKLS